MNADLIAAVAMHQDGRYADAARRYHAVLSREPNQVEALHSFGVMHHECGHSARAIELIERAAALRPGEALFYANMGEIHRALGHHQHAVECCLTALRLRPDYPEAANNIGLAYQALGRFDEAIERFQQALRIRPGFGLPQNNLGTLYRELDRKDEALAAFREAVRIDPALAVAHSNLGQALLDRGENDDGLFHCLEAVRLDSKLAAAHNNLGNAYRLARRWDEARAAYDEALRLAPDNFLVHVNLGLLSIGEGKLHLVAACFERAVEIAPDDPELWCALAQAHLAAEDPSAAVPWLERLVALHPEQPINHSELGSALQQDGRYDEAAASLARALELQPDFLDALLVQGILLEELGELQQAEDCYRRAAAAHPQAPAPYARLATLLRGRMPEQDRIGLRARLDDPSLPAAQRGSLLFGQAHVADADGDALEAAACLVEANAAAQRDCDKKGKHYDPIEHRRFVDRFIATFTPELFERLDGVGDPTRLPIFVVGMPRSGTTLVEQILSGHPSIHGAGELHLAARTFESIPAVVGRNEDLTVCMNALDTTGVASLSEHYLGGLQTLLDRERFAVPPDRVVDKMPDNYLYLGLLSILFPHATFVHVLRDPRDVALSCWMTNFRSILWANHVDHLAERFVEHRRLTEHWRSALPVAVHEVAYERLITDFDTEAPRLLNACGLDWDPACGRFHEVSRPVRTASVTQVRQPLYHKAVGRWRAYEEPLADLFRRLPEPLQTVDRTEPPATRPSSTSNPA